ncbi:family 16 glycoside hydrolase [Fodinibius sediminis]|uniref:HEAT repeat n=1 Tax=Fodinibius sediminis TaxID=1214077 RepID=A0A521EB14_9BACT|nr:family 16 glycoside hydrolase [Fodinibius sediminis]SMO80972.1 HEAT repeat [Fodinibius sediminis]
MRYSRFTVYVFLAALMVSCAPSQEVMQQKQSESSSFEEVSSLIADLPAQDQTENQWIFGELVDLGPSGVRSITDMLVAPGNGNDTAARFALNGLAKYVSRPGADTERAMLEAVLLQELESGRHKLVKVFLMEQLELVGSDTSVPVLQSFIGSDRLNESAVHALRAVNSASARQALLDGLSQTQTDKQRKAVIKTLGDLEVSAVGDALLPYITPDDAQSRKVTLYALAQSGNPEAAEALRSSLDTENGYQEIEAERYFLLYAGRLAEEGHVELSSEISRDILSGDFSSDGQSSALTMLVENEGAKARDELIEAAEGPDDRVRATALTLFEQHDDWETPQRWEGDMSGLSPAVQSDILAMLGRSGRGSLAVLSPFLDSDDLSVRIAAAQALALTEQEQALSVLFEALIQAEQQQEITALQSALLQLPTQPVVAEAADRLPSSEGNVQIALIELLAQRRASQQLDVVLDELDSADGPVRMAIYQSMQGIAEPADLPRVVGLLAGVRNEEERSAVQEAVVAVSEGVEESESRSEAVLEALEEAPDRQKPHLLALLPEIGGEQALNAVINASGSSGEAVQQAAWSALADWPEATAIAPLKEAFAVAPESGRSELLEGYIRLVQQSKYSAADKVQLLDEILRETSSTGERVTVINGYAGLESAEALKAVAGHFNDDDEAVKEAALRSAAGILSASGGDAEQQLSLVEATTNPDNRDKIEQYMQQLESGSGQEQNFTSLFNGEDLSGWVGDKDSYLVRDGQIISKDGAAGNLFTEQEYSNFILRFQFKLTPGANNGLGIRSPLEGNPAYDAMELQVIDNTAEKYAELEPYQFHGSVYGVAPAERGYLNPPGEWNTQEVIADGSQITVKVNGHTILDTNIEEVGTPETIDGREHPGLLRETGHIGFLGHGDEVAFRNIRIQDLDVYYPDYSSGSGNGDGMNQPPEGFKALFDGESLEGWKGLVGNPESRAEMSEEELARKQQEANAEMQRHWFVRDGVLSFDGEGHSLVTEKKYKDFEMMVDWKIEPGGDSGVYLRGTPQVQIWDITEWPQGSGGLYNNQDHPSEPLVPADNAIGEWNQMRIKMIGEKVTVHLNDQLVVDNVVLENYWNRDQPIYPKGQIELQSHSTPLYFKNIFIREIPRWEPLFNGEDLSGWERSSDDTGPWHVDDGVLYTEGGTGWLSTTEMYDNFKLKLEYRLPEGGNSGIFLRAPRDGNPAYEGMEIQLLDDTAEQYADLEPWQFTGSIYDVQAPSQKGNAEAGEWHTMEITADGSKMKIKLDGEIIINTDLVNYMDRLDEHPGLKRRSGHIGLQNHDSRVEFRNITIKELK